MRTRALYLAAVLLAAGVVFAAGTVQIWPKLDGVPNFSLGLPEAMYGQHPIDRESYGEGWFWLGVFDEGSYSFANFTISNLGPGDNKGQADMTVWEPSGQTYVRRAPFKEGALKAAPGKMDIQIGANHLWGSYPTFNLKMAEQDVALDLRYQATLPSFTINSGRICYGKPDDFYSAYITAPRAKVSGVLRTPSGQRQVNGFGYSDHGWVTMLPHEYSKRWFTLRCFHEKYTLDFLEFTTPPKWGGQRAPMVIFGANDKVLYGGPRYTLTPSDWQTEPKFGQKYPKRWDFSFEQAGKVKVEGSYAVQKVMHVIDVLSQLNFLERQIAGLFAKTYLLRFVVNVEATVTTPDGTAEKFAAPGVAEVIHFI
jgi:hypothetical protein